MGFWKNLAVFGFKQFGMTQIQEFAEHLIFSAGTKPIFSSLECGQNKILICVLCVTASR